MIRRYALLTGCASAIALSASTGASAQSGAPPTPDAGNRAGSLATQGESAVTQAGSAAPVSGLEDIVVTAQRRSENLQQVPISVTAASGALLGQIGVASSSDLQIVSPAVHVSTGLGGALIFIRGIGGTGSGADESANAVYIDGVYQPAPTAALFAFNNIERIEILKGPQGTLFGRNASGGLIQIITPAPSTDLNVKAEVGYGNYGTFTGTAYATAGLTSNVAIDVAADYSHMAEGWGRNLVTGKYAYKGEYGGVRSKLLWNIAPDTSLTLSALYSHTYAPNLQGGSLIPGELTIVGSPGYVGFYNINHNVDDTAGTDQQNYAATLKHDFGSVAFTSITSRDYNHFKVHEEKDLSPANIVDIDINSQSYSWTQEFQLASSHKGSFRWTLGAFYYSNDLNTVPVRQSGASAAPLQFIDTYSYANTDSLAFYGQGTYDVTPDTHVTAGLRYTIDKRRIDFTRSTSDTSVAPTIFPRQSVEDRKLTWRFAVDQQVSDRVLAYASYSRGFKSGLFNATNPGLPAVKPQGVDAYEVGLKSEMFDRTVRLNLSLFDNEVTGVQIRGIPAGVTTPIFYNGASATFKGVDLELQTAPLTGLTVQGNVSYLDGKYGRGFTNALYFSVPAPPKGGLVPSVGDASGNRPILAPEFVGSLSAQYRVPTPAGGVVFAGAYSYNGGFFFDPQNRIKQSAFSLVNASVALEITSHWTVRVWGENLGDTHYYADVQPGNTGDEYYPSAPRTYGVTVRYQLR
ncbi:MAG: TonB-dependent receptor [Janthinobacterium lividum]